jgi:hypothetical protein
MEGKQIALIAGVGVTGIGVGSLTTWAIMRPKKAKEASPPTKEAPAEEAPTKETTKKK